MHSQMDRRKTDLHESLISDRLGTNDAVWTMKGGMTMPRILLLQGANMNFLGIREPEKYGTTTAAQLDAMVNEHARATGYTVEIFYTNCEGAMIDRILSEHGALDSAAVLNPGGFCYAGYALRDCIRGVDLPVIEVHMTNHYTRGIRSVVAEACTGVFMGVGIQTYFSAIEAALELIRSKN